MLFLFLLLMLHNLITGHHKDFKIFLRLDDLISNPRLNLFGAFLYLYSKFLSEINQLLFCFCLKLHLFLVNQSLEFLI